MASKFFKAFNFFKGKVSPTIKSVTPKVNQSKIAKAIDDVKLTALKAKGKMKKQSQDFDGAIRKVKTKLGQTSQKLKGEKVTESGVSKGKDLREKKMGGGMMGRRMGYSQGSSKGKVPTTPKEKSLAKLAPPKDRITFGDVVAGRTKGKRMQAKHGTKDPMRDLMIDRKKQSLKTRSGATRPKPNENFDPNNPINKRKKQFKQEANKGMK